MEQPGLLASLSSRFARSGEDQASRGTDETAASRLYISLHTVNTHLRRVLAKLGVPNRVALLPWYITRSSDVFAAGRHHNRIACSHLTVVANAAIGRSVSGPIPKPGGFVTWQCISPSTKSTTWT